MIGDKTKNKINILCILAFIVGIAIAFAFCADDDSDNLPKAEKVEVVAEKEDPIVDEELIDEMDQWAEARDKLHGKKIHCDYCGGETFNKYKLDYDYSSILFLNSQELDTDRMVCQKCIVRAYIKGLDKVLGKPKYLDKRPKEFERE